MKAIQGSPGQILEFVYYYVLKALIDRFWNVFKPIFVHKGRIMTKLEELKLRNDIKRIGVLHGLAQQDLTSLGNVC